MQFLFFTIFHVFIPNKLRVFPRPFTHGGFPHMGEGQVQGGQSVNGGDS